VHDDPGIELMEIRIGVRTGAGLRGAAVRLRRERTGDRPRAEGDDEQAGRF